MSATVDLFIRSGLITGCALLLCCAMRKSSAAAKHTVLASGFLMLLLWPVLSAIIPAITIPVQTDPRNGLVQVRQFVVGAGGNGSSHHSNYWILVIWLAGTITSLGPALIGSLRLRQITRSAHICSDQRWRDLLEIEVSQARLRRTPRLLISDRDVMPFTYGFRGGTVVLPASCSEWTVPRRRIVLRHELAHLRRRDLVWQWMATAASALCWFQPLCWMGRSCMRRQSEYACDGMVVKGGVLASEYAGELLGIARTFRMTAALRAAAIGVANTGDLERRIRAVLNGSDIRAARRQLAAAVSVLITITFSASAITVSAERLNSEGGNPMKRTLISGLLLAAGLTASPHSQQLSSKPEPVRVSDGQPAKGPVRVGGKVAEANLVRKVQPVYPPSAKAAGVQGTVELDVTISKDGVPLDLKVVSSPSDDLSESAMEAVRQWRYRPTLLNGEPIEIVTDVIVNYTLAK